MDGIDFLASLFHIKVLVFPMESFICSEIPWDPLKQLV